MIEQIDQNMVDNSEALTPEDPEVLLFPLQGALESLGQKGDLEIIYKEYFAILDALSTAMDPNRILLVQSDSVIAGRYMGDLRLKFISPPPLPGYRSLRLGGQESRKDQDKMVSSHIFTRDLFSRFGNNYYIDNVESPDAQFDPGAKVFSSPLGEGGKVLVAGKSVVVVEKLWRDPVTKKDSPAKKDIDQLRKQGYRAVYLPNVDPNTQPQEKRNFISDHLDGHVSLIQGKDSSVHLLYARSYARQSAGLGKVIRSSADFIGANPIEIDDSGLPHLAFNLLQLPDGKVVMSSGGSSTELTDAVEGIVGKENVFQTSIPIDALTKASKGGIRCMTNVAPASVINRFNPVEARPPGIYFSY